MDVKEAVSFAKQYVSDLFADEDVADLGLEEVEFDDSGDAWRVTVGFSRPWQRHRSSGPLLTGDLGRVRNYKVVVINDTDKRVLSLRDRVRVDG